MSTTYSTIVSQGLKYEKGDRTLVTFNVGPTEKGKALPFERFTMNINSLAKPLNIDPTTFNPATFIGEQINVTFLEKGAELSNADGEPNGKVTDDFKLVDTIEHVPSKQYSSFLQMGALGVNPIINF